MIEIVEFPYNTALETWLVISDGIVIQCCPDEETAEKVADELNREVIK